MGRSLFSRTHAQTPAVRTEPDRILDPCQKWSVWNKFDPDSEEFFSNAQLEVPVDLVPDAVRDQVQQETRVHVRRAVLDLGSDSSDSSDSGLSAPGSPVGTVSEEAAAMAGVAGSRAPDERQRRLEEAAFRSWRGGAPVTRARVYAPALVSSESAAAARSYHLNRPRSLSAVPAYLPQTLVRGSSPIVEEAPRQIPTPPDSPFMAPAGTPLAALVPIPRSPSPTRAPVYPTTPTRATPREEGHSLVTPSPPGTVTPRRFYSWQTHAFPAIPTSPTIAEGSRDGPLTNPRARISYAQLSNVQPPVLVQRLD